MPDTATPQPPTITDDDPTPELTALSREAYLTPSTFGPGYLRIHPDTWAQVCAIHPPQSRQPAWMLSPDQVWARLTEIPVVADPDVPLNLWRLVDPEDGHTRRTGRVFATLPGGDL